MQGPAATAQTMFFYGSPILAQAPDRGKICFSLTVQAGHLTGRFSSSTGLLLMQSHGRLLTHLLVTIVSLEFSGMPGRSNSEVGYSGFVSK